MTTKKLSIDDLDFGDNKPVKIPYGSRKHMAFLIGSGFSVPCEMPTGKQLNDFIFNIDKEAITFDYSGKLATSRDGSKHSIRSLFENCRGFCSLAMKEYARTNKFDYERFYDFINSDGIYAQQYQKLAKPFLSLFSDYHQLVFNMMNVYTQIIEHELKHERKTEIQEGEFASEKFKSYELFAKYLSKLAQKYIVDVFSLNHDFLLENLARTNWINEGISDGFHNYRSKYYGELERNGVKYDCRLEEYKGYYDAAIRLYKLHGSLDYLMFKRQDEYGYFTTDKMIKVPYGIAIDATKKQRNHKLGYDQDWTEYHPDFLSGTMSKITHYKDSFYKKLFKLFEKNLKKAETLIVIGYGGGDSRINQYILKNFDFRTKPSFVIDPFFDKNDILIQFAKSIGAKPIQKSIDEFKEPTF